MKKVSGLLLIIVAISANISVLAQSTIENVVDPGRVSCYKEVIGGGDHDIVKCGGCINILDASTYSGEGKCKE